jgi:hypothetical protein
VQGTHIGSRRALDNCDRGARADTSRHLNRFKEAAMFYIIGIGKIYN